MKDKRFESVSESSDLASSDLVKILLLAIDGEYSEALSFIDEQISQSENTENKNIAALMSLQILALAGHPETASVLLKAMLRKFKTRKAKNLCKRTINNL